jgi:beta-lactamase class A
MAANSSRSNKVNSRRKTSPPEYQQQRVKEVDRSVSLFIYLVRSIIWGLGASAIAGTAISVIYPPKQIATKVEPPLPKPIPKPFDRLHLKQSSFTLTERLQTAISKNDNLDASYLFVDIDSGEYSQLGADRVLPAASTIKLPILIALFEDVDRHKVNLAEKLTIDKKSIAEGSGDLQEQPPGTQVSILVAATKMITISDNTATNLLIDRLGGKSALNQRFRNWGLKVTAINRPLPDLEGKNVTTARELARAMMAIGNRPTQPNEPTHIVSDASRRQIDSMLSHTLRNTMLPQGLGTGAKIAHKTGDIGSLIADVGFIEVPTGKKYIASVLVKRPYNDPAGPGLVRQMSKIAYEYFKPPASIARPSPSSQSQGRVEPKASKTISIDSSD